MSTASRPARGVAIRVVQGQRAAQQRIVRARQPQHQELAGQNIRGNARAGQSQAIGIAGNRNVLLNNDRFLAYMVGIGGVHGQAIRSAALHEVLQRLDLFKGQGANGAGRQFAEPHRPHAHTHEPQHLVTHAGQQAADLAVHAFAEDDLQPGAVLLMRFDADLLHPGNAFGQMDPAPQLVEHLRRRPAGNLGQIDLLDAIAGMRQAIGQFAVVGDQDQSFAVQIEPADQQTGGYPGSAPGRSRGADGRDRDSLSPPLWVCLRHNRPGVRAIAIRHRRGYPVRPDRPVCRVGSPLCDRPRRGRS